MEITIQDRDKALGRDRQKTDYIQSKFESLERFKHLAKIEIKISTRRKTENFMHYEVHVQGWCVEGRNHYHAKEEGADFFELAEKVCKAIESQVKNAHGKSHNHAPRRDPEAEG